MPVEIKLNNVNFSVNHLIKIYKMFCAAYEVDFKEDDKKIF